MEIVLPLGFADVIFRRERSDDRKYVCGSRASYYTEGSNWQILAQQVNKNEVLSRWFYCVNDNKNTINIY